MELSKQQNTATVVSIFVNPTQFNNPEDLRDYPRTEERDLLLLQDWDVDAAFVPEEREIYPGGHSYEVVENAQAKILCGAHRPGHFNGVLTVVAKLFNIVQPDRAYFGEKDFQQLRLITGMVEALNFPLKIVAGPTVREADGLAMSSRNVRLTPAERELASRLSQILRKSPDAATARMDLQRAGFTLDYVEDAWGRRLAAVHLGQVRLIDNVEI